MTSGGFSAVYYNPKQPTLYAMSPWSNPAIFGIFKKGEFWFYMVIHTVLAGLLIYETIDIFPKDEANEDSLWEAAGAFQYFTTFFLTFYNANCYSRYEKLYFDCTTVMDAIMLFVRELTISFKEKETWKHRLQATKYLLASADIFFFSVTGNALTLKEWEEVVKKGLLAKSEASMLMKYPGPEVVPILTTWSMLVVGNALQQDCFHDKEKVQKIAHFHNRLDTLQMSMMHGYRNISETMAFPIPFAYWHLMNLVFSLNFFLLALQLAAFQHWMTVVPYAMALLTFMGLREVSNQLADPFGEDIVDFPLGKYLDHVFDHSIALIQAFSTAEAYDRTKACIYAVRPFDFTQMIHTMETEMLVTPGYQSHIDSIYIWERETPLRSAAQLAEAKSLMERLTDSLARFAPTNEDQEDALEFNTNWQRLRNKELHAALETLEQKIESYEQSHQEADAGDAAEAAAASAEPLPRPADVREGNYSRGEHQWGRSDDDDASSTGRRPRKPHKMTGEGLDRSFRFDDISFSNFDAARQRLHRVLTNTSPSSDGFSSSSRRSSKSPSKSPSEAGSRRSNRSRSKSPSKEPSEAGSRRSNGSRAPRQKADRRRSPDDANLAAVPEDSRV